MRRWPWAILRATVLGVGYLAVMAWLTWPLAARATSALPHTAIACFFDTLYSAWTLSYESHALVSVGTRLADANIYHPASNALFYGPAALGALPLFAPVFLATGNPVLAINVTFLLGLALTGVAMHVVVRRWTGSDLAGVVAAVTVLFNRWIVWGFVPTAPHWAALFGFPLIAFAAALRLDSLRSASLLVSLVVLQCLTDLVYVAPAVLGPLSVLAAFRLLRRRSRAEGLRLLGVLGLASLMLVPIFRGYSAAQRANPDLAKQTIWSALERVWPAVLPRQFLAGMVPFTVTPVMGGLVILGGLLALWRRRQGATPVVPGGWSQGALWTIVGAYLSLPNTGVIAGIPFVTLMGRLAHLTSIVQAVRAPSRLGVAGVVGLGILSGVAFGEVCAATRAWVRPASLALVLRATLAAAAVGLSYGAYVGSYRPWTGSGRMFSAYPVYVPAPTPPSFLPLLRLSRAPLLELPVGKDGLDPGLQALAMFHSISHWRPLLNGYSSYWPAGFPERMAEANRLPDQAALDHLAETTGLSLVWVHTRGFSAEQRAAWTTPPRPASGHRGFVPLARDGSELLLLIAPGHPFGAPSEPTSTPNAALPNPIRVRTSARRAAAASAGRRVEGRRRDHPGKLAFRH